MATGVRQHAGDVSDRATSSSNDLLDAGHRPYYCEKHARHPNAHPAPSGSRFCRSAIRCCFRCRSCPINVGRPRSVRLVEDLLGNERALVGVLTQRNAETVEPTFEDLYAVGTLARVVKVIRLGPSNYSVVLNGLGRFRLAAPHGLEPYMRAEVAARPRAERSARRARASSAQRLRERTREVLALMPNLPKETASILDNVREPGALADLIASNFPEEHAGIAVRQGILEAFDVESARRAGARAWSSASSRC